MKLINVVKLMLSIFALTYCTNTSTETEDKILNKINISEAKMRHKTKKKIMSTYTSTQTPSTNAVAPGATISSSTVNDNVSTAGNLAKTSDVLQTATGSSNSTSIDSGTSDMNIGEGPIFFSSWIKYFKISETVSNGSAPKEFFKNPQYVQQLRLYPGVNLAEKSSDSVNNVYTYITSEHYFYIVLFKYNMNFLSSRQRDLQKTVDTLDLTHLQPVQEGELENLSKDNSKNSGSSSSTSGVQDFGDFSEGFCLKLTELTPKTQTWVICTETKEDKEKLMNKIIKMKLLEQREKGQIMTGSKKEVKETLSNMINPDMGSDQNLTTDSKSNLGVKFDSSQKITDGYWIILQEWTQCSLKCGGGTSTLQRMCVPPKNGGKPCQGEPVMTKPCNNQKCPDIKGTGERRFGTTGGKVLKPIVKVMQFSSRPQRFTKCVVKEADLMMVQDSEDPIAKDANPNLRNTDEEITKVQIPTRVVMNNRTFTVFAGESYQSHVITFDLAKTTLLRGSKRKECFFLQEGKKQRQFCPFGNDPSAALVEEWDYDFNLFKKKCFEPREKVDIELEKKLKEKLDSKINKAKGEMLAERETEVKKEIEHEEEQKIESQISTTNKVALQAIQKELNLEALVRQEEMEREKKEETVMMEKIEEEKKKSECLMKAIKERQLENQFNIRAKEAEEQVKDIKKVAADQVQIRRSMLKTQIKEMRKKYQHNREKLSQQLSTVRLQMADTMNKVYKKGDSNRCREGLGNKQSQVTYCQANFMDDYSQLENCKEGEDFCRVCCDNEFGEMNMNDREECYRSLCQTNGNSNLSPTEAVKKAGKNGRWIWQNIM